MFSVAFVLSNQRHYFLNNLCKFINRQNLMRFYVLFFFSKKGCGGAGIRVGWGND